MGLLTGFQSRAESAGTLENPSTSIFEAFDIDTDTAGVTVNSKTGLRYPAVFRALSLISGDTMRLPLLVFKRAGEGKRRAPEHPAYGMLKYQWNDTLTAAVGKQLVARWAAWRGNGYAFIQRRADNQVKGLYPLSPENVVPCKAENRVYYWYVPTDEMIGWRNMLHIRGMGSELKGYSLVDKAKESLGIGLAAQKYGATFFENNAQPSVVFQFPGEF